MKEQFSLKEIFGKLPVHPSEFKKLNPRLKWYGKCTDGDDFCSHCGTLTPDTPKDHHIECVAYIANMLSYPDPECELGGCPDCGDTLYTDSCSDMEQSWITCGCCDFRFKGSCDEETLEERFKKKFKRIEFNQEAIKADLKSKETMIHYVGDTVTVDDIKQSFDS